MKTYNDIYLEARRKLRAAGIDAHDLEARLIVSFASGKPRELLLGSDRFIVVSSSVIEASAEMIKRRLSGEPVAYITGEWEFYGLPMSVSRDVLIPRVDTELLAGVAIGLLAENPPKGRPLELSSQAPGNRARLLDLCAGSGCVGIAVAANVPDCRVVLADNSLRALAISRMNMKKNRVTRNVTAIEADALEEPQALLGTFDVLVSNPPYIPTAELKDIDRSVRDHEPMSALDGGEDGLAFFRSITGKWIKLLKQDGQMALECGIGQAGDVRDIMQESGFRNIKTHIDTLGIERVIVGTKRRN